MTNRIALSELFREGPRQWGLRGDPHLWREMRERFELMPCPHNPEDVAEIVSETFQVLTGQPITHGEPFFLPQYAHGGMSSGYVNPGWWRDTGILFLQQRLEQLRPDAPA
jgi:hypothetical protein